MHVASCVRNGEIAGTGVNLDNRKSIVFLLQTDFEAMEILNDVIFLGRNNSISAKLNGSDSHRGRTSLRLMRISAQPWVLQNAINQKMW